MRSHSNLSINYQRLDTGVIELPISANLIQRWSSGDYADLYSAGLSPADIGFTYAARYPSVMASILAGSGQVGPVIEATAHSWPLALCFYVLIAGAASYNFYLKYNEKKQAHQKVACTHNDIAKRLGQEYQFSVTEQPPTETEDRNFLVDFNTALAEVMNEEGSSKKYESMSIEDHNGQYKLSCKFKTKTKDAKDHDRDSKSEPELADAVAKPTRWERFKNAVSTTYSAIGLGAFTYWILWIGSAIATGNFADAGIAGLSPWISFGLPILATSTYPALKIRNWIRKGGHQSDEHARLTKIAETDTPELMAKALKRVEFNRVETQLKNEYLNLAGKHLKQAKFAAKKEEVVDKSTWSDPKLQAAAALYTGVAGHYGMSQYNAWVTSDFFKVVFNAATSIPFIVPVFGQIVGSVLIAIGAGLGLKEMWNHYKEAKAQRKNAPKMHPNFRQSTLEEIFEERKRELNHLNHQIAAAILNHQEPKNKRTLTDQEASDIMAKAVEQNRIPLQLTTPLPKDPPKQSLARQIYNGLDWFATGAFFGRLVSVPLTAIFIPFAIPLLSNPITISMIALAGAIFLGCKFYQAYQKSKKMQAERFVQKIQELDEKIHLSKLTNVNLQLRNKIENQKQQGSGFTNSPTSVPKPIVHTRELSVDNGDEKSTPISQLGMFASDGEETLVVGSPQTPRRSRLDEDSEENQLSVPLLQASRAAETDNLDDPSDQDAEFDSGIPLTDFGKKGRGTLRL